MTDRLHEKLDEAFEALAEAERLAYAAGLRSEIGLDLVEAHSKILKARNRYREMHPPTRVKPLPGVFDLRRQLGRAPTAAEFAATRGR